MAFARSHYPEDLNPFGSDDEDTKDNAEAGVDDYPDYLSPFGVENVGEPESTQVADDYDDSLNPFGSEGEEKNNAIIKTIVSIGVAEKSEASSGEGNPFGESGDDEDELEKQDEPVDRTSNLTSITIHSSTQPDSLDGPPPVPLPRTKSLLKKEQAQKNRQQRPLVNNQRADSNSSTTPSTSETLITATSALTSINSFQKKKNKRNAPPVPVNFKRQVSGSLDAIEAELNDIGDKLAVIEKESNQCQDDLKAAGELDEAKLSETKSLYIDLIKRRNVISRRQRELMYRKRELKLDQIHSDIEYELRMIGNKQQSHRTGEDKTREEELLKRLVEIVEEKNDIVENLNKDTSCDSYDIGEALRRLNLLDPPPSPPPPKDQEGKKVKDTSQNASKNGNCDKVNTAFSNKLSKIATLLPKSGTIKGTMKIKRKRLFKKGESRSIERSSGRTCSCNGAFYSSCPNPPPINCIMDARESTSSSMIEDRGFHMNHPDHVDSADPFSLDSLSNNDVVPIDKTSKSDVNDTDMLSEDTEKVVRHRKVYVSEKEMKKDPVLIPLKITIPVKFKPEKPIDLPPPKPMFKMRKYTKYETMPETIMVPVETTVIKPIGISKDQLIDEKKAMVM